MTEPRMLRRIETFHDLTVSEIVDWCHQRGLNPDDVKLSGGHLKWESPETEAEATRREEYHRQSMARHEEWERETYERLKEKFDAQS